MNMISDQRTDADRLVAGLLIVFVAYVLLIAGMQGQLTAALMVILPIAALMALRHFWVRAPAWLSYVPVLSLCALSVLQAKLMPGSYLAHASMFVALCVLIVYEDWRRILIGGGLLLAARWIVSDWWDGGAKGSAAMPSLLPVVSDTLLLALLTVALALHAKRMRRRSLEHLEMEFLVRAMGKEGPIRLNFDVVRANSPIGGRLKDAQSRMAGMLREVRSVIFNVHTAAEEMSNSSTELMDRTLRTNVGLSDAAMSLEQINVIVQESARASREARGHANQASMMAGHGGTIVQQVVSAMREIDASGRRITDIIGVIDTIAFQTNILALNAAVEAARAGESGRGFAVVAAEVRMLAQRSSEAAREIKTLIGDSVASVDRGTKLADEAGQAMTELVDAVRRVGSVFESLTADSSEHAQGIDVITASVRELDAVTQQNVQVADRSSEIAFQLQSEAAKLAEVLSGFRLGDDEAVDRLREEAAAAVSRMNAARQSRAEKRRDVKASEETSGGVDFF